MSHGVNRLVKQIEEDAAKKGTASVLIDGLVDWMTIQEVDHNIADGLITFKDQAGDLITILEDRLIAARYAEPFVAHLGFC
jgi:hypothetical protein